MAARRRQCFLSYDELADQLIPYALDLGFTHIEMLPGQRAPARRVMGLASRSGSSRRRDASASRKPSPALSIARHGAGLGVILDWVPSTFPHRCAGAGAFRRRPALRVRRSAQRLCFPIGAPRIYDFGRKEVANFLYASALFWIDRYHVDGLRVDAVASMLYLDYSRKLGEWLPNAEGGNENRKAMAAYLKRFQRIDLRLVPRSDDNRRGVHRFSRASRRRPTSAVWVSASSGTWVGCTTRWNTCPRDPIYRRWSHDKMTFGLVYAFAENFILPIYMTGEDRRSR